MSYSELFNLEPTVSFETIMNLSTQTLSSERRRTPWLGLAHGVKLLENDEELAQYICAYGRMHKEKIDSTLESIQDITIFTNEELTIIDWGCGQALATICFLDYMNQLGLRPRIKRVILIEPSRSALERAQLHLGKYMNLEIITPINKYLNDVTADDIRISEGTSLHFFSNILDIETVDIDHLFRIINEGITSKQLFFCVSPQNVGASKIESFASRFNISCDDIVARRIGNLAGRGTINMLVFKLNGEEKEIVKVEFARVFNDGNPNPRILQNIVDNIVPADTFAKQVIQFYEAVIKYERKKSSDIGTAYPYPMNIDNSLGHVNFKLDIQSDPNFENEFRNNFDRGITRWPKNLYVGLQASVNGMTIKLLSFIYPQEDLREFEYKNQLLTIPLYEFSLNRDEIERLGVPTAICDEIETLIREPNCSIDNLEQILKDAIANNLILDRHLYVALSNEDVSLSQIQSELGKLRNLNQSTLLNYFLNGCIEDNSADFINPDTLLHVRDMDESQRTAIATALNSKVSVITGPPGTGKTQMILNLVVNALAQGKKILVASKNNKAIDNIKERYDNVDPERYMLRFGSRTTIQNNLLPYLQELCIRIPNMQFDAANYNQLFNDYKDACDIIKESYEKINLYETLKVQLSEHESILRDLLSQEQDIERTYLDQQEDLSKSYYDIVRFIADTGTDWSSYRVTLKKELNSLQTKVSGLRKLFFLLFQKRSYSERILNTILSLPHSMSSYLEESTGIHCVADVKEPDQLIQISTLAIEKIERIKYYIDRNRSNQEYHDNAIARVQRDLESNQYRIIEYQQRINAIESQFDQIIARIEQCREQIGQISVDLLRSCVSKYLLSADSTNSIARYRNYLPNNVPSGAVATFIAHAQAFLNVCRLNAVTSLSAKNAYPLKEELFDIVIIDEASQCDIASALPLIQRTKQLVVIGDPLQLRHISIIKSNEEQLIKNKLTIGENPLVQYSEKSLWDYCHDLITTAKNNNHTVVLDCQYRCHPQIIGYSNEFFYRRLGINLRVSFEDKHPELKTKGVFWKDVKGHQFSSVINRNDAEVNKSIECARKFASLYPDISIGIISPFKHQAQEINAKIPQEYRNRIVADTVHKFQGDERDIIIYSLVVTDNSPDTKIRWIDNSVPNLVNVAVTRARSALIVVGNKDYIRTHSNPVLPLGYLVNYINITRQSSGDHIIDGKTYIINTDSFIKNPDVIERIDSRNLIVISSNVIDQLEHIKGTSTGQEKQKAELALDNIHRISLQENVRIENADISFLPNGFNRNSQDNLILCVALRYRNQKPILMTSDNSLLIKARSLMIETVSPSCN